MSDQYTLLPRFDLREPAFRRYESYIARACAVAELVVHPGAVGGRALSAHTFCCRFRDACLGYRRYRYASELIPRDADVSLLSAAETSDGRVVIVNTGRIAQAAKTEYDANEWGKILDLAARLAAQADSDASKEVYVKYHSSEQRSALLALPSQFNVSCADGPNETVGIF